MKTQHISALVLTALAASLTLGCENAASTGEACVEAPALAGDHVYVFSAGSGDPARVERMIRPDGSETLSGVTKLQGAEVKEYAEVSPDGRLAYADVLWKGDSGVSRRLIADAAHGAYYVQDEHGSGWKRMPTDAPWVLASLSEGTKFAPAPTPVSAWITVRAAEHSSEVRVLDASLREGRLVARDQLVVSGRGDEHLVIAGERALVANGEFVTSLGDADASPLRVAGIELRARRVASR